MTSVKIMVPMEVEVFINPDDEAKTAAQLTIIADTTNMKFNAEFLYEQHQAQNGRK